MSFWSFMTSLFGRGAPDGLKKAVNTNVGKTPPYPSHYYTPAFSAHLGETEEPRLVYGNVRAGPPQLPPLNPADVLAVPMSQSIMNHAWFPTAYLARKRHADASDVPPFADFHVNRYNYQKRQGVRIHDIATGESRHTLYPGKKFQTGTMFHKRDNVHPLETVKRGIYVYRP